MPAALLAAVLVFIGQVAGWRGVDMAASVYRVNSFRSGGFSLWDFQWYGGHFTLNYSVIYPPLASALGIAGLAILSAAMASLAFERIVSNYFGDAGKVASLVFGAGTLVQSSIGQLPFLTGEAFGLAACWAATRNRWILAGVLALACSTASPLAGAFVIMGVTAWLLARWKDPMRAGRLRKSGLIFLAAGVPILATAVLFPGIGTMPYPTVDFCFELVVAASFVLLGWLQHRPVVVWMAVVFVTTAAFAKAIPSSLGGNVGRIEDLLALPVAAALLWEHRRLWIPLTAWPLLLSQWVPAWGAIANSSSQPSTHEAFFTPLDLTLQGLAKDGPPGRVEVVPTEYHWEAAYVAPVMPLARGWERQLDVVDNPLFYRKGPLSPTLYRDWLISNGVRFVALGRAPLDSAGMSEAALIRSGRVPGLSLVWRSSDWRVYSVDGGSGIISGAAELVSAGHSHIVVDANRAGSVLIRVHFSRYWRLLAGQGCVTSSSGSETSGQDWLTVDVPAAEQFSLTLSLFGDHTTCSAPAALASQPVGIDTTGGD